MLAGLAPEEREGSWHLVLPDGRRASRGTGAVALARALGWRRAAALLRLLPLEPLYALVAGNRGRLGRLVPDGPAPERYP